MFLERSASFVRIQKIIKMPINNGNVFFVCFWSQKIVKMILIHIFCKISFQSWLKVNHFFHFGRILLFREVNSHANLGIRMIPILFCFSTHPYLFFNPDHVTLTFLGFQVDANGNAEFLNPQTGAVVRQNLMSRHLRIGLHVQRVDLNNNFESYEKYVSNGQGTRSCMLILPRNLLKQDYCK